MAKLAIQGHSTRGKEVIQLLEMLGADRLGYKDTFVGFYYYIECDAIVSSDECPIDAIVYTLEEFLEKFPYKVGDDVLAYAEGCLAKFTIQDIRWNYELNKVEYKICSSWLDASLMQSYKEETMETLNNKTNKVIFESNVQSRDIMNDIIKKDMKEIKIDIPKGYEFFGIDDGNKIILTEKQPKYPKTYGECSLINGCENRIPLKIIGEFIRLINARNAYWKIAGEEMGLGKPWKPDWNDCAQHKFGLYTLENEIRCINLQVLKNIILVFPTEEMRDKFYENFKELIENCKELL